MATSKCRRTLEVLMILSVISSIQAGTIHRRDTYSDALPNTDEEFDINDNMIFKDDSPASVDGLLPPKQDSVDYFKKYWTTSTEKPRVESPYEIDPVNKVIKLKVEAQSTTENPEEEVANVEQVKTILDFFSTFLGSIENETVADGKEADAWTETTTDVATEISTISTTTEEDFDGEDEETGFMTFLSTVWKTIRESTDYISGLFRGLLPNRDQDELTTESDEVMTTETPNPGRLTSSTSFFAVEEPVQGHHLLPSFESDKRNSDIHSILYGQGIV